jgi:hypothetical protein
MIKALIAPSSRLKAGDKFYEILKVKAGAGEG